MDFAHLWGLGGRGVWWVTRAKDNMAYRVRKRLLKKPSGKVLRDDLIYLGQAVSDGATAILEPVPKPGIFGGSNAAVPIRAAGRF